MGRNVLSRDPKHESLRKIVYREGKRGKPQRSHRFVEPGVINVYPESHPDKILMFKRMNEFGVVVMLDRDFEKKIEYMFKDRLEVVKRTDFFTFKFAQQSDEVMFRVAFL